jgi:16S rRNA (guanine527-N7)-methyltransferase
MNIDDQLARGIEEIGLHISSETRQRLIDYLILLDKWNKVYNLTAVHDIEQMVTQHLLDCLAVLPFLSGSRVLDVGSGGGLPGIPFALVKTDWHLVLLDSNHKKASFLKQACIELKIENAEVCSDRVESLQGQEKFDLIISRAFSDLVEYTKLTAQLCNEGGIIAAMKGVYPYEELAALPKNIVTDEVVPIKVPGLKAERHLVIMKVV